MSTPTDSTKTPITPGPWTIYAGPSDHSRLTIVGEYGESVGFVSKPYTRTQANASRHANAAANAYLIAAAPDLLGVCRELLDHAAMPEPVFARLQSAIAKAEGR